MWKNGMRNADFMVSYESKHNSYFFLHKTYTRSSQSIFPKAHEKCEKVPRGTPIQEEALKINWERYFSLEMWVIFGVVGMSQWMAYVEKTK